MPEEASKLPLLPEDERTIDTVSETVWDRLRGSRILVTGGTGFVGTWLVAALAWANREMRLGLSATMLSRDPEAFLAREPWVARQAWIRFQQGDARETPVPPSEFSHAIVGAATTDARVNRQHPLSVMETVLSGTARVLRSVPPGCPVLVLSSGAVYGDDLTRPDLIPEGFAGPLDWLDPANAYHESKRAAEAMVVAAGTEYSTEATVARLFAFHGPWLPTDRHFAMGNFLRDALEGRDIVVNGDGTPVRSYMYGADMAGWLLTLLALGRRGQTYNVGSDRPVSVAELAHLVAASVPELPEVRILGVPGGGGGGQRYVPDVTRARDELGLRESVSLEEGISRTVRWHRAQQEGAWA